MADDNATKAPKRLGAVKLIAIVLGALVAGSAAIVGVVFESYSVEGPGMEPTHVDGDRVLARTVSPHAELGRVLILITPGDGFTTIKRVVAVGGDTIEIRDDRLIRNGREVPTRPLADVGVPGQQVCLEEELGGVTYRTTRDTRSPRGDHAPVQVPEGHVYVLGDHRDRSNDSRYLGPVPLSNVIGEVTLRYWNGDVPHPCTAE